jgi:beta-glucosidase
MEKDININRNPIPKRSKEEINNLVKNLMSKMTLKEKIGQMYQTGYTGTEVTGPQFDSSSTVQNIKDGSVGSIIGLYENTVIYNLQKVAVENSRLGIPLLFCNDIIHGCRTAFPINLALSASWNPQVTYDCASVSAYESSHSGVNLVFSPMLDLVRDPRWGRVMESNGEDPYLSSVLAKAYVEGYQGDLTSYDTVAACAKHYVGYGAAVGGREYNTVDFSRRSLFQYYLKPFKAAIESDVKMVMTSFNVFEDVPVTANKYLLKDVLRDKLGFDGVIISDYTSSMEIMNHKIARTEKEVAKKCIQAGLDHEMIYTSYINYLEELVNDGEIDVKLIDESCYRVLYLKYEMGLFDNPYKNIYLDFKSYWLSDDAKAKALNAALECPVLLKNNNAVLPIKDEKIAIIGPLAETKRVIGPWGGKAEVEDCISLLEALNQEGHKYLYAKGSDIFETNEELINEAIEVANQADKIVLTLGEHHHMAGEANARSDIRIPDAQIKLIDELAKLGKPMVLLTFASRPLDLTNVVNKVDGILYVWFLGTMSGVAIEKLIYGKVNPSGKLTISFPYTVGQVPVYYNCLKTGRPYEKDNFYCSRYMDIPNEPLYPFGYGLSYSKFTYSNLKIENKEIKKNDTIKVSVEIKNESNVAGYETVQLYIEALSFSVARPVLELKGFKKLWFEANESKIVTFDLDSNVLSYYNIDMEDIVEDGEYNIFIGPASNNLLKETITYEG